MQAYLNSFGFNLLLSEHLLVILDRFLEFFDFLQQFFLNKT